MKVIFLDIDGCVRLPVKGAHPMREAEMSQDAMHLLANVCNMTGSQIVVSSDWRNSMLSNKDEVQFMLHPHLSDKMHEDWGTPVRGWRWQEILAWLKQHPEVTEYAVIDDMVTHFEGAPMEFRQRIVLCDSKLGIREFQCKKLVLILGAEPDSMNCPCSDCNPGAWWMILCPTCGNKRCPHATNHELACTNSNEPGQAGSAYE